MGSKTRYIPECSVPAKPLCRATGAQPLVIGAEGTSENK